MCTPFFLLFFSLLSLWGKGKDSLDNTTKGKKRLLFDALCVVSTTNTNTNTFEVTHTKHTRGRGEEEAFF
jgi:hypothetical protein